MASRRPLPVPPTTATSAVSDPFTSGMYNPNQASHAYLSYPRSSRVFAEPATTLPGGTLLHQGFYDLLSMIPTPSPSRLLWGANWNQQPEVAPGPRYETHLSPNNAGLHQAKPIMSSPGPVSPKKRRISKDMVSNPTGFVCVATSPSHFDVY